jgi:hypothetical protein
MSKGAHGVFPADDVLQLCGDGGRGGVFLLVTSGDGLPSASVFRLRPPRGRLCWSSSQLLSGGCAPAPLSFRWSPWIQVVVLVHMQLRHADGAYHRGVTQ